MHSPLPGLLLAAFATLSWLPAARAADEAETWSLHGQATWIGQRKPAFASAYTGPNSLSAAAERSYSFTATAGLGARAWSGGELYADAELVQGLPLSGLTGLGGLTNGELQKTAGTRPLLYRARAFVRQTWDLEAASASSEAGWHQLAGPQAARRIVLTAGNLSITDLFDDNRYAHDPRTQFLNWALLTHGAYDFAADSRGYSNGAALEFYDGDWSWRAGRFEVPRASNGLALDPRLARFHGDQAELAHEHRIGGLPGVLRALAFRNVARMAGFDDAIAAAAPGDAPSLDAVRRRQSKAGWGLAAEQSLPGDLGAFARIGRHDGRTEPYSFTSIDDAWSAGLVAPGSHWARPDDQLALAVASSGLSHAHRRFLAAGGSDFFIGDGALRYGREQVLELSYGTDIAATLRMTADWQRIAHPAYNRDRGPVQVLSLRLHAEL